MKSAPPRFTIAQPVGADAVARIEGSELHHMRDVLRIPVGAVVSILDPAGNSHRAVVERYERRRALVRVNNPTVPSPRASPPRIILAAAIVKGPRMDFVVEKAAELGVAQLWPIVVEHGTIHSVGQERLARWRRLALGAAKQSLSENAMQVDAPISFDDLIRSVPTDTLAIICAAGAEPLGGAIRRHRPRAVLIAVGPEGGFTDTECAAAARANFVACALGPNRLRSETAAIAAVSIAAGWLYGAQGSGDDGETK